MNKRNFFHTNECYIIVYIHDIHDLFIQEKCLYNCDRKDMRFSVYSFIQWLCVSFLHRLCIGYVVIVKVLNVQS